MAYLGFLFAIAAVIWIMALVRSNIDSRLRVIPIATMGVVLFGSVFGHAFFHKSVITLDRLLLAGLCGLFALGVLKGNEKVQRIRSVDWAVVILTVFLALNTFSRDYTFLDNLPFSRYLFFVILPVAVYFLARNAKLNLSNLKIISLALAVFAVYLAMTGVAETKGFGFAVFPRYIMNDIAFEEFFGRARGPFLNPVSNGLFMIVGLAGALMWWPHVQSRGKMTIVLVAGIVSLGVFATLTRSVWMSLVLGIGMVIWLVANRQQRTWLATTGAISAVLLAAIFIDDVQEFKRDKNVTVADMKESSSLRPLFAIVAWNMFQDRPILGCGFGQYLGAKEPYLIDPHSGKPLLLTETFTQHNIFLAFLTESGLVGLAILLLLLFQFTRISLEMFFDRELDAWVRAFGLILLVFLIVYTSNGMFHDVSIIPQANMLMFCLAGLVTNLHYGYCTQQRARREEAAAQVTTGVLQANEATTIPA